MRIVLIFLTLTIFPATLWAAGTPKTMSVVVDGDTTEFARPFLQEVISLNQPQFDVQLPDTQIRAGKYDGKVIRAELEAALNDPKVDFVIALGVVASHIASTIPSPKKPLFGVFVMDPKVQGMPSKDGASGVKNFNYLTIPYTVDRALTKIGELYGSKQIDFFFPQAMIDNIPKLGEEFSRRASEAGIDIRVLGLGDTAEATLAKTEQGRVVVVPPGGMPEVEKRKLITGLKERKFKSFSYLSSENVQLGLLAGEYPTNWIDKAQRRLAINVQRALLGENPATFGTQFQAGAVRLFLNLDTARAVGYEPSFSVAADAKTFGDDAQEGPMYTFDAVVRAAGDENLDIRSAIENERIAEQDVDIARANLLPDLSLAFQARLIDADRARAGFGQNPQILGTGSIALSQLIYSDRVWAGLFAQETLVEDAAKQTEIAMLDVVRDAAVAYVNVLRARSLVALNERNLESARDNLELAYVRQNVGSATAADPLRWQSEIARLRRELFEAFGDAYAAETQLNRVLNRPEREPFQVEQENLEDHELLKRFERVMAFLDNRSRVDIFSDFIAEEAVRNAPELERLELAKQIQEREITRVNRSFFIPDISLTGNINSPFIKEGDGSDLPPNSESPDDLNFELGVGFSLPLFDGGARYAEKRKAQGTIVQLQTQLDATKQRIRQSVRVELINAMVSFLSIDLSKQQSKSARETLKIVEDAYVAGSASVFEFIDARDAAFAADTAEVNAVYDFIVQMALVARAMGTTTLISDDAQSADFAKRLNDYFQERTNSTVRLQ